MRAPSTRAAWLLLCLSLPTRILADDAPRDETTRWIPSIGVNSSVLVQEVDAAVSSSDVSFDRTVRSRVFVGTPPPGQFVEQVVVQNLTTPLRPSISDDDRMVSAIVNGTLELMTPGFQRLPGRPRFFVHGGAGAVFGQEHHVARERSPSSLDVVDTPGGAFVFEAAFFPEDAFKGIGSETTAEIQPFVLSAGAGVAFSFDLYGRRLRVKPSIEYLREEIDLTGSLVRAVQIDTGIQQFPPNIPERPSVFIPVELKGNTSEIFQGLGPGLELEMDARRAGPFMLSIFASAQFYKILGDTEVEFSEDQTLDYPQLTPTPQTVSADWSFEKDPWSYRGGIGIRFRWLPE